jgi:hypothetical protein
MFDIISELLAAWGADEKEINAFISELKRRVDADNKAATERDTQDFKQKLEKQEIIKKSF